MNSCQAIRDDLADCLSNSPCMTVEQRSANDCLRNSLNDLPMECQHLYKSFVACKRGMLDMRKRFRGNAPPTAAGNRNQGGVSAVDIGGKEEVQEVAKQ